MRKNLEDLSLPPGVLALLEGYPARPPVFPGSGTEETDLRITPGGPSSSEILRTREESIREDLDSLLQETVRVRQETSAANVLLSGISAMQQQINSVTTRVDAITGSAALVDFYSPGTAFMNTSTCIYESLWGQATLPYASNPQSQIVNNGAARPGTIVKFTETPQDFVLVPGVLTFGWNETDPSVMHCVDGRLDTAFSTPLGTADLFVSITLPPTLGANSMVNSIGLIPWPLFGCSIREVWVRNGASSATMPGWTQLSLQGQLGYDGSVINNAGPCRFFFEPSPVREIMVRLRRTNAGTNLGLVMADAWVIEFEPTGVLNIEASAVGKSSVNSVTLGGINPSSLAQLPVTIVSSQVSIDMTSVSSGSSPIITSVGLT